jgi:hypothetical protein
VNADEKLGRLVAALTNDEFWHAHPPVAWTIVVALPIVLLFAVTVVWGNREQQLFSELLLLLAVRVFLRARKEWSYRRRLKPSPFFFWF